MSRSITLFLLILALLSLTAPSWASIIYVSGEQTGAWAADTVIVTGEVRVPPGASLTILPGVEVLFSVYCKLIVDNGATLRAVGTAADSIRFDALQDTAHWHGIRFLSASDSSRLEYCHLTHGKATGSGEDLYGGAIYCFSSSPTISGNTISGNSAGWYGGGIYCNNSSPTISGNTISGNSATSYGGGGIYCNNSSPTISNNTISVNSANYGGGGIYCDNSSPTISGNTISGNSATSYGGGGIYCENSSPTISRNIISGNSATDKGGGICSNNSSPTISGNTISGNSASNYGGGISCFNTSSSTISNNTLRGNSAHFGGGISCFLCSTISPTIIGNTISGNSATGYEGWGGGISCEISSPTINRNTISGNSASFGGGGIDCYNNSNPTISNNTLSGNSANFGGGISSYYSSPTLGNCILWGNSPEQIYGAPIVTYSDIEGGYAGTGNINTEPLFVNAAQDNYRLQWGSPCIDTGDPNPFYNDPDGTRADMGAWYYDQSMPVRILLTPYNAPIEIPAAGGSFQYNIQVTNIAATTLPVLGWCNVTLPNGNTYGPVLGPLNLSLGSEQTLSRLRTQTVPASAPAGLYHYNAFAVAQGDTSTDSFTFVKLSGGGRTPALQSEAGGWTNTGEEIIGGTRFVASNGPEGDMTEHVPPSISPNPFNPATTISHQLSADSFVSLRVYDTAGRLVETLVDGWREAGEHQATFDGTLLPSGVYLYRLEASGSGTTPTTECGKMVLLK